MHFSHQLMQRGPQFIYLFEDSWPGIYCLSYLRLSVFMYMIIACLEKEAIPSVYSQYLRQLQQEYVVILSHVIKSFSIHRETANGGTFQHLKMLLDQNRKIRGIVYSGKCSVHTEIKQISEEDLNSKVGILKVYHHHHSVKNGGCLVDSTWMQNDFKMNWKCTNKPKEDCRVYKNQKGREEMGTAIQKRLYCTRNNGTTHAITYNFTLYMECNIVRFIKQSMLSYKREKKKSVVQTGDIQNHVFEY